MLLSFTMKNFKSFYELTKISMIADNTKRELNDRLIKINDKINKKVLPSMVIYGANASGKTSIISAINLLKQIVINGTIKKQIKNSDINKLDIVPFIHDNRKLNEPIHLEITFKTDEYIYNYLIDISAKYTSNIRKIVNEELNKVDYKKIGTSVKEVKTNIFRRYEDKIEINKNIEIIKILGKNEKYIEDIYGLEKNFSENLDKEDLFLTTGFKSMISLKMENDIIKWFQEKLVTIIDFNQREPFVKIEDNNKNTNKVFKYKKLDKLIKLADFGPQEMGYMKDNNTGEYKLNSFYKTKNSKNGLVIDSKMIESRGTIKLIDFWIAFMDIFEKGGIFVLDEFDCSIHPELIGGIIDLFNNKEINVNNAQLIFNTHNPLYLQRKFFRRDQIMFVEKNEETYMSLIYKLSDIEIRNDANYLKNYFEGKFGALPFIDFELVLDEQKRMERKTYD